MSGKPEIRIFRREEADAGHDSSAVGKDCNFIILGSDGLWDVFDSQVRCGWWVVRWLPLTTLVHL